MMKSVRKIDVLSLAKTVLLVYGFFSLIFFPLYALKTIVFPTKQDPSVGLIMFMMVLYPLMVAFVAACMAWVYNLCATWTGGIKIELSDN